MVDRHADPLGEPARGEGSSGEMARRIGAADWAHSPLGPAEAWPERLRTLVALMLDAVQPMFLTWGPQRIVLYNDGYATLLGRRHPEALGRSFAEVWPELADQVFPILDRAYAGEATAMSDIRLVMHRHGYAEVAHFAFSYTPVRNGDGTVAGMFCACTETTAEVRARALERAERERLRVLFSQAPGFMAVLRGPDHVFEIVNDAYALLVGRDRALVGCPVARALPELADQGFLERLDEVRATGLPFVARNAAVLLARGPAGEAQQRFVDFVFQPIVDEDGEPSAIFVQGVDVTEHVAAETALRVSEERRRLAAEAARIGVFDLDLSSRALFLDEHARALLELPSQGPFDLGTLLARVDPEERAGIERVVRERIERGAIGGFALEFRTAQDVRGARRWIACDGRTILQDDRPARVIGTLADVTERRIGELRLAEIAERYRLAARATNDAIRDWDLASDQVIWNRAVETLFGHGVIETQAAWMMERVHPDDRARVEAELRAAIDGGGRRFRAEYRFARADGSYAFVLDRGYVLRDGEGRAQRVIGAMLDLSERRRAEERQALIQRELHHRVKNTLATVQAIAASTMRTSPSPAAFRAAFTDRLISLGRTHTLLIENAWEGAGIAEILRLELEPYADGGSARIALDGPRVALPADVAVAFGMAAHELTTNAAKHGALSGPNGRVVVSWSVVDEADGARRLRLRWSEEGGPPVAKPTRRGFGTQILERALAVQLHGHVRLAYEPAGLEVEIEATLAAPEEAASGEGGTV